MSVDKKYLKDENGNIFSPIVSVDSIYNRGGGTLFDSIYPVGSIYLSTNSTNPSTLFGGTWEQIKDRFLLACGNSYSNGATGGEATHKLTTSEIPKHTHGSKSLTGYSDFRDINNGENNLILSGSGIFSVTRVNWSGNHDAAEKINKGDYKKNRLNINATHEHSSVGGNAAHNNMPPYIAVYIWKRTA